MPRYTFFGVSEAERKILLPRTSLPTLDSARHEAKRLARICFGGEGLNRRIEVEQEETGVVLVVPLHERVWLDA